MLIFRLVHTVKKKKKKKKQEKKPGLLDPDSEPLKHFVKSTISNLGWDKFMLNDALPTKP